MDNIIHRYNLLYSLNCYTNCYKMYNRFSLPFLFINKVLIKFKKKNTKVIRRIDLTLPGKFLLYTYLYNNLSYITAYT